MAESRLPSHEMSKVVGGACQCGCGCLYANQGGSSTGSNANANKGASTGEFFSSKINVWIYCDGVWTHVDADPHPGV